MKHLEVVKIRKKYKFFLDLNTGAVGSFIRTSIEPSTRENCVTVWYTPLGSAFKEVPIPNVPKVAIREVSSKHMHMEGVQAEGYVILIKGQDGKSDLMDDLGIDIGSDIVELKKAVQEIELSKQIAEGKLRTAQEGVKEKIKEQAEVSEILFEKPKRKHLFDESEFERGE